ncbi:hypothetical protein OAV88_00820 [bacterium]|nr:hypothetical protein [bacterium]
MSYIVIHTDTRTYIYDVRVQQKMQYIRRRNPQLYFGSFFFNFTVSSSFIIIISPISYVYMYIISTTTTTTTTKIMQQRKL